MKRILGSVVVLGCFFAAFGKPEVSTLAVEPTKPGKLYEMRTYVAQPGKLDALHARFRDHTCRLFQKHGIEVVGFWAPCEGEAAQDTLIYIVAFPDAEAQKKAWAAFRADPEWQKAKADSERDGPLVKEIKTQNLKATNYSPLR
jgi:hypothetical protein